jgi:ABC-type uncharacterized transport system involved in gliding motility auxiliary subunit
VQVKIVDPEPFSEAEEAAVQAGLVGKPIGLTGTRFFFGLVGEGSTEKRETIPVFDRAKEEFLEYELTRTVYLLSNPTKNTIGLMAQLPVEGMQNYPLARGQNVPAWRFVDLLKDYFDVKTIAVDKAEIPADLKVLMLIHPKNLSEAALYAVDQFVLRGGRLMVFVDPWCEADLPPGINPMNAMQLPRSSDLRKLFDAWGVELVPDMVAADEAKAVRVTLPDKQDTLPYLGYMRLDRDDLSQSDAVMGTLEQINVAMPGALRLKPGAAVRMEPLIETTTDAMLMDAKDFQYPPDPRAIFLKFKRGDAKLTIAARLSGRVNSAFPNGDPAKPAEPPKDGVTAAPTNHLAQSKDDIQVVVVADCDMLSDPLWIQEQRIQNIRLGYTQIANNGDFVVSMADNLCGSKDLLGLRARGKFARPFDRIQKIQKEADQRTMAAFKELQAKRQASDQQITEIISKAPPGSKIMLSPEDKAKMTQLRTESARIGRQLRDIQYQRNKDVERIGTTLKFVNIGLMPVLVGVAAVGLSAYRANRRRTWSHNTGART